MLCCLLYWILKTAREYSDWFSNPGACRLLLYLMRQSLYRSMSGRWYFDWVCCCLAEPGISSIPHETIPLQEYERAVIFRLRLLLSSGTRGFLYLMRPVQEYERAVIFRLGLLLSCRTQGFLYLMRPVQEYERAVIFRLGLLLSEGARDFLYISWHNPFTGVWAGGDISTGSAAVWWSPGSGSLLHHSVRRHLREDRHANSDIWRAAPGGQLECLPKIV